MSKLVLLLPDSTTLDVPLARERITIGRRADNDICLPNLAVSSEHAVVVTILEDSFLEDLNSTNGTLVNGNAVAKHFLRDRDQIDIGRHKLVYCVDNDAKLEPDIVGGMARLSVRDFGARVESAKPFVRTRQPPDDAPESEREPLRSRSTAKASDSSIAPAVPSPKAPPPPKVGVTPHFASVPAAAALSVPTPPAPPPRAPEFPAVKLLSGVSAGRLISLTKGETTLGRPGVQVAAIVRAGMGFRLKPLEGASPPTVNGKPVDREGLELAHGDVIDIAGRSVEFINPQVGAARQDVAA
jgi:pSer/pThr/pTyr-binding forkhead associated (FHA) protein